MIRNPYISHHLKEFYYFRNKIYASSIINKSREQLDQTFIEFFESFI